MKKSKTLRFKKGDIVTGTGHEPEIKKGKLFVIDIVDDTYQYPYELLNYPDMTFFVTLAEDRDLEYASKLSKVLA